MKNWLWSRWGDLEDWFYFRIGGLTPVRRTRLREADAEIERQREAKQEAYEYFGLCLRAMGRDKDACKKLLAILHQVWDEERPELRAVEDESS